MQFLRSLLYAAYFYGLTVLMIIVWIPLLILPRSVTVWGYQKWGKLAVAGLKVICGTRVEYRGLEHIKSETPVVVAAKHQSVLDILCLFAEVPNPAFVSKRELLWIPIAGLFAMRVGTITINRGAAAKALKDMVASAERAVALGRSLVIFPEGTRKAPGAAPDYKPGIAALYTRLNIPCVPVALNSGVFWPRRKWMRYPGTVVIEALPAIEPGLKRKDFMARLESAIEGTSSNLPNKPDV